MVLLEYLAKRRVPIEDFLLGIAIVQSFHELNEYAESMIILHPTSARKNGTGPLAVCLSLAIVGGIGLLIFDPGYSFFDP